ncbi:DUF4968 domain-containing protein, partial [bacterium]|nr:DUF4968 domain-containing protein [bacterium]
GPVRSVQATGNGVILHFDQPATLELAFWSPSLLRVTLHRQDIEEELLTEAVVATPHEIVELQREETESALTLNTSELTARILKSPLQITLLDAKGHLLQRDDAGLGHAWDGNEVKTWKESYEPEKFFGLGLKGGGLDKRGREWQMWNSDIPAYTNDTDPLYQSVPFYIGLRDSIAYGVFLNNSYRSKFNFRAGNLRYTSFSSEGGALDYFVIAGPSIPAVVRRFSDLTGKMPLPPLWALGYQQCRWSYYPDSEVRRLAQTFREKDIPCDAIYLDIHHMDGYRVFTWDKVRFPQPAKMMSDLEKDGFKIVTIVDPGVKVDSNYFMAQEGLKQDHFVKMPDGNVHIGEVWPGPSYFPDYSKLSTRKWWGKHVADWRKVGVRGFWNDMNEPACWGQAFPLESVFDDNGRISSHKKMHNLYGLQMARATYENLREAYPDERPFILTRAGFVGTQRYAAAWTGDNVASWEHLELGIRMMLSMSLSGQPFIGTDIGGFIGTPSPELYARWIQVGAFSPLCRTHTHANSPDQEPWSFGEEVEAIAKKYISMRYEFLPYLYSLFYDASETGEPILRPLFYNDQNDPKCYDWAYQHQFFVGPDLLIAPVTKPGQYTQKVYLPEGTWLDWNTEKVYSGKQEIVVDAPLDRLPMFVRNGAIIFRRDVQEYTDERPLKELIVDVFGMSNIYESPFTHFSLREEDGRKAEYAWGTNGASTRFSRTLRDESRSAPDRKLRVRIHGYLPPLTVSSDPRNARIPAYSINDEQLQVGDPRVRFDEQRQLLEIVVDSELQFRSFSAYDIPANNQE